MATIVKQATVDASPADVWDAVGDFAAVHERLVPGFLTACRVDGDGSRVVTFFNGAVAREILVGVDDERRRLAYSVVEGPVRYAHHHASVQVLDGPGMGCTLVWITDVLPGEHAPRIDQMMTAGIEVMKRTLSRDPAA